jgi:hypothetical protein
LPNFFFFFMLTLLPLFSHIHWYERLFPLGTNGTIDKASILGNNTYSTNPGVSMIHIINGMAGNIESHSTLDPGQGTLNITAVLDQTNYGFSKLTVLNCTALKWQFIHGADGSIGDELTLLKNGNVSTCSNGGKSATSTSPAKSGAHRVRPASFAGFAGFAGFIGLAVYFL